MSRRRWDPSQGLPLVGGAYGIRSSLTGKIFVGRSERLGWRVYAYSRSTYVGAQPGALEFVGHLRGGQETTAILVPAPDLDVPEPMDVDRFWELIEAAKLAGLPDARRLWDVLDALPTDEIAAFHARYQSVASGLCVWPLWHVAYIVHGGCSNDGFEYFRSWLVCQGRTVVAQALADPPGWAMTLPLPGEEPPGAFEAEVSAYLAPHLYLDRTGRSLSGLWPDPTAVPAGQAIPEEDIWDSYPDLGHRWEAGQR